MFESLTFSQVQGAITIQNVYYIVSKTAETIGSPGAIAFKTYLSMPLQETSLGINFVTAPVWFPVDFPTLGRIYYKWMVVEYRYRAGGINENRTAYIGLEGFQQN